MNNNNPQKLNNNNPQKLNNNNPQKLNSNNPQKLNSNSPELTTVVPPLLTSGMINKSSPVLSDRYCWWSSDNDSDDGDPLPTTLFSI